MYVMLQRSDKRGDCVRIRGNYSDPGAAAGHRNPRATQVLVGKVVNRARLPWWHWASAHPTSTGRQHTCCHRRRW